MSPSDPKVLMAVCLGVVGLTVGAASAQSTSTKTETRTFEVVAVDGNRFVVREAGDTKEYTVPESFRFSVGGKTLSVHDLKPGMQGTATFTTTTTVKPVTVTEVKEGTVMQVVGNSVIVRGPEGIRMFSPGDLEKRNIRIVRNGRIAELSEFRAGDRLTATIVTEQPPQVLTEQQVKATIDAARVPAAATPAPTPAPPAAAAPATAPPAATPPAAAPPGSGVVPEGGGPTTPSVWPMSRWRSCLAWPT
jgi:hypothetical protein